MADLDTNAAPGIAGVAKENIKTIAQIEQEFYRQRSAADRLGERIMRGAGSIGFALSHVGLILAWVVLNTGCIPDLVPFDPFPFSFLGVIVSLEAVLLSTFVLMTQKRQSRQADHWAHLNLQIGLLAEQETTKMLQLLTAIGGRLGLKTADDSELQEMVERTSVNHLAQELADKLEESRASEEPVSGRTEE